MTIFLTEPPKQERNKIIMDYLYLGLAIITSAMLSIMSSLFGKKNEGIENISPLYSLIAVISACVCWGFFAIFNPAFKFAILGYSLLYGIFYSIAMIGMFLAYKNGSTPLTAFVKQLSFICVAVWGFIFWKNPITATITIGLILVIAALILCFAKNKSGEKSTVNFKWVIFAAMLLVGNSGCSIIQKYQQLRFDGKYRDTFMFFALVTSVILSVFIYMRKNRCKFKTVKTAYYTFPILAGVSSAMVNLFIMLLMRSSLSESIVFPAIAVGGLGLTLLFSAVYYREKLTPRQWCGLLVGTVALVFLNL